MGRLREHWRAFWRSGPENLCTFIWWSIFAAILAGVGFVGSWSLGRIRDVSPMIATVAAKWEDRFLSAFVALLLVSVATVITIRVDAWRARRQRGYVRGAVRVVVPSEFVILRYNWGRLTALAAIGSVIAFYFFLNAIMSARDQNQRRMLTAQLRAIQKSAIVGEGPSPPASGSFRAGDIWRNTEPRPGGTLGWIWVCDGSGKCAWNEYGPISL